MDDDHIVDLFLARDESAIRHTREKFGPRLRTLSQRIVQDPRDAEECECDTYLGAWNSIPPHEPREYLFAFLARITRHLSLDLCRRSRRLKRNALLCELTAEMEACIPAPDDCEARLEDKLFREVLNAFLASLSEEKRNIFLCRYWYMDSVSAIAQRFGLSESKVKTTLFRCRKQLREYLLKEGYIL